jgi:D-glycero-D-manno-heptose 1,7-bisphosphate phosphatase
MKRPAVFLDRDGVINEALVRHGRPYPPVSLAELQILPGVAQALCTLRSRGYALIIVTNQPDVGRGTVSRAAVERLHRQLREELPPLDAILTCYHDGAADCDCRKPRPGLLLRAAAELDIELQSSFMVGDRWRDIQAGRRAGCRTFFVDRGYDEPTPADWDFRVDSLPAAARIIVEVAAQ